MGRTGSEAAELLRRLPAVDRVLASPEVARLFVGIDAALAADLCRREIDHLREMVRSGRLDGDALEARVAAIPESLERRLRELLRGSLRKVVNATGVVVHTNLGRAPLSAEARRRVDRVAAGYSSLEYDLETGRRGSRQVHAGRLLERLFPSTGSLVVNNNAAAVLLALNTLAEGRDVLVSRGELVEIGGSFRVPAILEKSGGRLREVGTTNRTRLTDYRRALSDGAGVLLKVWPSNYRIVGFTESATVADLAGLAQQVGVPLVVDQGCGALVDLGPWGIEGEPTVADLLRDGADLVCFSGDKLLGGPQAGVMVGRPELVDRCRSNPLARALRCDKMTLAALEATLASWVAGAASTEVPVARMLADRASDLDVRAGSLAEAVRLSGEGRVQATVRPGSSRVGGGAAPEVSLPTSLVAVSVAGLSAAAVERGLRASDPPIVGRIAGDELLLDPRTLGDDEIPVVARALGRLARGELPSRSTSGDGERGRDG